VIYQYDANAINSMNARVKAEVLAHKNKLQHLVFNDISYNGQVTYDILHEAHARFSDQHSNSAHDINFYQALLGYYQQRTNDNSDRRRPSR